MKGVPLSVLALALTLSGMGCALINGLVGDEDETTEEPVTSTATGFGGTGGATSQGGSLPFRGEARIWAAHPPIVPADQEISLEGEFDPDGTSVELVGAPASPDQDDVQVVGVGRATFATSPGSEFDEIDYFTGKLRVTTPSTETPHELDGFRFVRFDLGLTRFQDHYPQTNGARALLPLDQPRLGHTAEVVGNRIYLLGSTTQSEVLGAAVRPDGTLDRFAPTGVALAEIRAFPVSVRLGDRIYVIGGETNGGAAVHAEVQVAEVLEDGSLDAFTLDESSLTLPRSRAALAVIGRYVYVIGGKGAGGELYESVERAEIAPDGELGSFQLVPNAALQQGKVGHTVEVVGSELLVIGGAVASSAVGVIERATIGGDGSIEGFEAVTDQEGKMVGLRRARAYHQSVVLLPKLYVLGGNDGQEIDSIEEIQLDPGGGFTGEFQTSNAVLPAGRSQAAGVIVDNDYYLIGGSLDGQLEEGSVGGSPSDSITRGPIVGDVNLHPGDAPMTVDSLGMHAPRSGHVAAPVGPELFLFGGWDGTGAGSNIASAPVQPDGTFGDAGFEEYDTWNTPRRGACAALSGERLYLIGGEVAGVVEGTIECRRWSNGNLVPGCNAPPAIDPRRDAACVAIGRRLYLIGGRDASATALDDVLVADIAPDGRLDGIDGFSDAGDGSIRLETERYGHTVAVLGRKIYVFGGADDGGVLSPGGQAECADILADGQLGNFTPCDGVGSSTRVHAGMAVVGPYLLLLGGSLNGSNAWELSDRWTIDAAGGLSGPSAGEGPELNEARKDFATVVLGHFLYVLGGSNGSSDTVTVQSLQLQM